MRGGGALVGFGASVKFQELVQELNEKLALGLN